MSKFNAMQIRFVKEYSIDCNATQAAIRAGYSAKTARAAASRLLARADIQEAIAENEKPHLEQLGLDEHFVLSGLKGLAICCSAKDDITKAAFNPHAAIKAYMAIGTHLRMFTNINETKFTGDVDLTNMPMNELKAWLANKLIGQQHRLPKQPTKKSPAL